MTAAFSRPYARVLRKSKNIPQADLFQNVSLPGGLVSLDVTLVLQMSNLSRCYIFTVFLSASVSHCDMF